MVRADDTDLDSDRKLWTGKCLAGHVDDDDENDVARCLTGTLRCHDSAS